MNNIVLTGVLQNFNQKSNGRIYPNDVFDKAVREFNKKLLKIQRKEKLEKINKNHNKN